MPEDGIFDPAKVARLAPQTEASVADLPLTTEVVIAETPNDDEHAYRVGAPGAKGVTGGMDM